MWHNSIRFRKKQNSLLSTCAAVSVTPSCEGRIHPYVVLWCSIIKQWISARVRLKRLRSTIDSVSVSEPPFDCERRNVFASKLFTHTKKNHDTLTNESKNNTLSIGGILSFGWFWYFLHSKKVVNIKNDIQRHHRSAFNNKTSLTNRCRFPIVAIFYTRSEYPRRTGG